MAEKKFSEKSFDEYIHIENDDPDGSIILSIATSDCECGFSSHRMTRAEASELGRYLMELSNA